MIKRFSINHQHSIVIFLSILLLQYNISNAQKALGQSDKNRRPNVIYIYADDLGYGEVGAYGQQKIQTPNLDRMAKEGMRFH